MCSPSVSRVIHIFKSCRSQRKETNLRKKEKMQMSVDGQGGTSLLSNRSPTTTSNKQLFAMSYYKKSLKIPKGNQNPYIEEEQTIQQPKEKVQKDKQLSTKHTHKTKDRVTRTPLKTECDLRCSGRVSRFCFSNRLLHANGRGIVHTGDMYVGSS